MQEPSPFTGWYRNFSGCREDYRALDARVDAAGARNSVFYRVPGFPYLRTDRLLASYREQVHGLDDTSEWLRRMRDLDLEAREPEYTNLGLSDDEAAELRNRLLNCGRVLAAIEFENPDTFKRMVAASNPVSNYSEFSRWVGLHWLAAGSTKKSLRKSQQQALAESDLPPAGSSTSIVRWSVSPAEDLSLLADIESHVMRNDLGIPNLTGSEWRVLVEHMAPELLVSAGDESLTPSTPTLSTSGVTADPSQPLANYHIGYTRFGGETLVQISYFFWFKSATGAATGPIDGLIWRVTLDRQLRPLTYESVRGSGNDHRWYPVQDLRPRISGAGSEPEFIATRPSPALGATLRVTLASGAHQIQSVEGPGTTEPEVSSRFTLKPYEDLFSLKAPGGGTRSMFDAEGIVAGSYDSLSTAGTSSGIRNPGAIRLVTRMPIAIIEERHFDDAYLLEDTFDATKTQPIKPSTTASR